MSKKINKVCFVGLGYVGLPTAVILADKGVKVHGYDISERAVKAINSGKAHIKETNLDSLLAKVVKSKKLIADTKPTKANVFVIAVPTPFNDDKTPDMSYVFSAGKSIAPYLEKGNLVILESTSPVGSTEKLKNIIAKERKDLKFDTENPDILFAYCPERILPGNTLNELVHNSRSIGGVTKQASIIARDLYKAFCKGELVLTDAKTAEMTKLVENSFRDVNIAFANELAIICDKQKIDVHEVISLANRHPRVNILTPATGVGGHCIPVDPWFILADNPDEAKLIHQARLTNDYKPIYTANEIVKIAKEKKLNKIIILGLTYKPDVDDFRHSPAFDVINELVKTKDLEIFVHDPYIEMCYEELPKKIKKINEKDILKTKAIILLNTTHKEYKKLNFKKYLGGIVDPSGFIKK